MRWVLRHKGIFPAATSPISLSSTFQVWIFRPVPSFCGYGVLVAPRSVQSFRVACSAERVTAHIWAHHVIEVSLELYPFCAVTSCLEITRTTARNRFIQKQGYARFEVLTGVIMKNGVFWDATSCGSCKNQRFGIIWRLLHQGDKNLWARSNTTDVRCASQLTSVASCS
jgi:hypothetical protein